MSDGMSDAYYASIREDEWDQKNPQRRIALGQLSTSDFFQLCTKLRDGAPPEEILVIIEILLENLMGARSIIEDLRDSQDVESELVSGSTSCSPRIGLDGGPPRADTLDDRE